MKRLLGLAILFSIIGAAGGFLATGPRWVMKAIAAPKNGALHKASPAEMKTTYQSAQRRKLDRLDLLTKHQ